MKQLRWGVVGAGTVATMFARGLSFAGAGCIGAVTSRTRRSAEAYAARFGCARVHDGVAELVADPEVDVVYVASLNHQHAEHCLQAIEAGKPVLCEKPFALGAAEARTVIAAARRRGVFCMEAMWMRFSEAFQDALTEVRDGTLGEARVLTAQLGFPHAPDPSSRLFAPGGGGGALLDLGVYPLSLAQALWGPPLSVRARAVMADTDVDEQVSVLLEYAGGRHAMVVASLRTELTNAATIHGTEGNLRLHAPLYFPERFSVSRSATAQTGFFERLLQRSWTPGSGGERTAVRRRRGNGYTSEALEVARCLRAGLRESPGMPLDDTLAILEVTDEIRRCWRAEA